MSTLGDNVTGILYEAEVLIRAMIEGGQAGDGWSAFCDDDGNINPPSDEREVLVFLCGDMEPTAERPGDAGYGMRFGWFDIDHQRWRVGGSLEDYVTHWRDLPPAPTVKA